MSHIGHEHMTLWQPGQVMVDCDFSPSATSGVVTGFLIIAITKHFHIFTTEFQMFSTFPITE